MRTALGALVAFALAACAAHAAVPVGGPLEGLAVTGTVPGGRGELAGLVMGDIVTACEGVALNEPRRWRDLLDVLAKKPTVSVMFFRGGERLRTDMVPGALDVYVSAYRRNYDLFLAGPHAEAKWNDAVKAGYEAFEDGRWRASAEWFQKAVDAGLADRHVLKCLGRSYLACLDAEKAHSVAERVASLGGTDDESISLLYWSSLMAGRPEQASRLRKKLPIPEVDWATDIDLKKDVRSLEAMQEAKKACAAGGSLPPPVDPIAGRTPVVKGLQIDRRGTREAEINMYWRDGDYWRWKEMGGRDRLEDFVFRCNMEQKWEHARYYLPVSYVFVRDTEKRFAFHVGVDRRGRLLLGLNMPLIVGPCEALFAAPECNSFRIARKGAQLDAFVNGTRVATVYVPADRTLLLWVGFRHGGCSVMDIDVVTPGGPLPAPEVF